ncbi:MAG: hypothetical protein KKB53_13205, partial [Acidobacteria bacterium]|nr:hypothetical protein [Acidobacteriota bacterium]MCG2817011.1 hypothetical protein [Candidatus Aminicenantes bacterium]
VAREIDGGSVRFLVVKGCKHPFSRRWSHGAISVLNEMTFGSLRYISISLPSREGIGTRWDHSVPNPFGLGT